jgi:hypothetical protein
VGPTIGTRMCSLRLPVTILERPGTGCADTPAEGPEFLAPGDHFTGLAYTRALRAKLVDAFDQGQFDPWRPLRGSPDRSCNELEPRDVIRKQLQGEPLTVLSVGVQPVMLEYDAQLLEVLMRYGMSPGRTHLKTHRPLKHLSLSQRFGKLFRLAGH